MCLLPLPNTDYNSIAYKKGVYYFDCGACPECLKKRSSSWALRSVYESKSHVHNCMITLTYDNFAYDSKGNIIGELPVNRDLKVNQRDIQLFIKRLRKWYSKVSSEKIKYIACAEYGSRTHRAHYHCILFGVQFPDIHFYKKSKRGNVIYMSKTLTDLWSHGICTVDSINVHSAIARYCTKYCAKSRSDDTFMLSSQRIGFDELIKEFNGISYFIDGREYTIPRFVWEYYIFNKYCNVIQCVPCLDTKYVNYSEDTYLDGSFSSSALSRRIYRQVRDSDPLYQNYISYWSFKGNLFESKKLPARERILQLDDTKYHFYKVNALRVLDMRSDTFVPYPAPSSGCVSAFARHLDKYNIHLPYFSRPNTASDTTDLLLYQKPTKKVLLKRYGRSFLISRSVLLFETFDIPPDFC